MRKFFNGLVVGILFGAVGFWFVQAKVRQHLSAQQRFESSIALMGGSVSNSAGYYSDDFASRLEALDLLPRQIKKELADGGLIIRRKPHDADENAVNAASDTRAVAALRAEYSMDPDLANWQIAVTCNKGHVALSGMVSSPKDIGRAMTLALQTDGVHDVTSTLQVKNNGLAGGGGP